MFYLCLFLLFLAADCRPLNSSAIDLSNYYPLDIEYLESFYNQPIDSLDQHEDDFRLKRQAANSSDDKSTTGKATTISSTKTEMTEKAKSAKTTKKSTDSLTEISSIKTTQIELSSSSNLSTTIASTKKTIQTESGSKFNRVTEQRTESSSIATNELTTGTKFSETTTVGTTKLMNSTVEVTSSIPEKVASSSKIKKETLTTEKADKITTSNKTDKTEPGYTETTTSEIILLSQNNKAVSNKTVVLFKTENSSIASNEPELTTVKPENNFSNQSSALPKESTTLITNMVTKDTLNETTKNLVPSLADSNEITKTADENVTLTTNSITADQSSSVKMVVKNATVVTATNNRKLDDDDYSDINEMQNAMINNRQNNFRARNLATQSKQNKFIVDILAWTLIAAFGFIIGILIGLMVFSSN